MSGADEKRRRGAPASVRGRWRGSAWDAGRAGAAARAALVGLLEAPGFAGDLDDLDPVTEAVEECADAG